MKQITTILLLSLLILTSCSKEDSISKDSCQSLIGEWIPTHLHVLDEDGVITSELYYDDENKPIFDIGTENGIIYWEIGFTDDRMTLYGNNQKEYDKECFDFEGYSLVTYHSTTTGTYLEGNNFRYEDDGKTLVFIKQYVNDDGVIEYEHTREFFTKKTY